MRQFNSLFPLWAALLSVFAFFFSEVFAPLQPGIVPLLATVMFTMGLTLRRQGLQAHSRRPSTCIGRGTPAIYPHANAGRRAGTNVWSVEPTHCRPGSGRAVVLAARLQTLSATLAKADLGTLN
jgi:hypothetical protein